MGPGSGSAGKFSFSLWGDGSPDRSLDSAERKINGNGICSPIPYFPSASATFFQRSFSLGTVGLEDCGTWTNYSYQNKFLAKDGSCCPAGLVFREFPQEGRKITFCVVSPYVVIKASLPPVLLRCYLLYLLNSVYFSCGREEGRNQKREMVRKSNLEFEFNLQALTTTSLTRVPNLFPTTQRYVAPWMSGR